MLPQKYNSARGYVRQVAPLMIVPVSTWSGHSTHEEGGLRFATKKAVFVGLVDPSSRNAEGRLGSWNRLCCFLVHEKATAVTRKILALQIGVESSVLVGCGETQRTPFTQLYVALQSRREKMHEVCEHDPGVQCSISSISSIRSSSSSKISSRSSRNGGIRAQPTRVLPCTTAVCQGKPKRCVICLGGKLRRATTTAG